VYDVSGMFNLILIIAGLAAYSLYGIDPINNRPNVFLKKLICSCGSVGF
jgi:hypothetical protein